MELHDPHTPSTHTTQSRNRSLFILGVGVQPSTSGHLLGTDRRAVPPHEKRSMDDELSLDAGGGALSAEAVFLGPGDDLLFLAAAGASPLG
jgi:hypothetical protein